MSEGIRKIRNNKGFTLAENLVAILIMLMVTGIVVAGIPAAKNAYDKIVTKANAETLLSTATYTLRNELSTAKDINIDPEDNTTITFFNGVYDSYSKLYVERTGDDPRGIVYQRYGYLEKAGDAQAEKEQPLVSQSASDGMYITYDSAVKNGDVLTFTNLSAYRKNKAEPAATYETFSILLITNG